LYAYCLMGNHYHRLVKTPEAKVKMRSQSAAPSAEAFVRAFVAIAMGKDVRARLTETMGSLQRAGAHVAWVAPANIHLSLAFLGNVTWDMVPLIGAALDEAAAACAPFSLAVAEVGSFGSARSPRVIWAGVRESPALRELQGRVARGIMALGLTIEEREYRPHLTLGRVRSSRGRDELVQAMAAVAGQEFGRIEAREVLLMKSRLLPAGAEHSVVHRAPCATADAAGSPRGAP